MASTCRPASPLVMELQQSHKMQSLAPSLRKLEEDRARRDRHRGKVDSSLQRLLETQALASIHSVTPQLGLANIAVTDEQLNRWRDIHRGKVEDIQLSLTKIAVTEEELSTWGDLVEIESLAWSTADGGTRPPSSLGTTTQPSSSLGFTEAAVSTGEIAS